MATTSAAPMLAAASAMKPSSRRHFVSGVAASAAALPRLASAADGFTKTESGLQFKDLKEGDGAVPAPGQTVKVHYTGWLNDFDDLDGKFDSSYDRGKPLTFAVGTGRVIKGWDEALLTMKVGGTRRVVIPSEIGYGAKGAGGIIPGGATLYFEVELAELGGPPQLSDAQEAWLAKNPI